MINNHNKINRARRQNWHSVCHQFFTCFNSTFIMHNKPNKNFYNIEFIKVSLIFRDNFIVDL